MKDMTELFVTTVTGETFSQYFSDLSLGKITFDEVYSLELPKFADFLTRLEVDIQEGNWQFYLRENLKVKFSFETQPMITNSSHDALSTSGLHVNTQKFVLLVVAFNFK